MRSTTPSPSTSPRFASALPNEALFQTGIGTCSYLLDEPAQAKQALERAVQLDDAYEPSRRLFQPHYLLGLIALQGDELSTARSELSLATNIFPLQPAAHFYLGETYEKLGQDKEALKSYEKVIELEDDPEGTFTTQATQRMNQIKGVPAAGTGGKKQKKKQ